MSTSRSMKLGLRQAMVTAAAPGAASAQISALAIPRQLSTSAPTPLSLSNASPAALVVLNTAKDISEVMSNVPYVKGIAGIVAQIVQIHQELHIHSNRCNELIESVYRSCKIVFEQLNKLGSYSTPDIDDLTAQLKEYHDWLIKVVQALTRMSARNLYQRVAARGLDELDELERTINSYKDDIILRGVLQLQINAQKVTKPIKNELQGTSTGSHLIPAGPICLMEREAQQEEIIRAIQESPGARVAILGFGGIGKTTLACSAMRDARIVERYPRQFFVSFEGLETSELAYTSLATTLGIILDETGSQSQILLQILSVLSKAPTLICLDNFETFWERPDRRSEADTLLDHLLTVPSLAIIVTLRGTQLPGFPGRIAWSVRVSPKPLTMEASKMLVQRIIGQGMDAHDDRFVEQLLEAVEGLPLAVTLIGTLLQEQIESAELLWSRWSKESPAVLSTGQSGRQYQLDVSIKISVYSPRIDDKTRSLLAAIAMLPAGLYCDQEWIEEYQKHLPDTISLRTCLRNLRSTALCSLEQSPSSSRIQLLSPVREFCLKELPMIDNTLINVLIDLYVFRMSESGQFDSPSTYHWVVSELANIDSVLHRAFSTRYVSERLGYAAFRYTRWMNFLGSPSTDIIQLAISGDILIQYPVIRAYCIRCLGEVYSRQGQPEKAIPLIKQSLDYHEKCGDAHSQAHGRWHLGRALTQLGQFQEAESQIRTAINIWQEIGDIQNLGNAIQSLAEGYVQAGGPEAAQRLAQQAMKLHQQTNDKVGQVNGHNLLGGIFRDQGKNELARSEWLYARNISREINYTQGEAEAMLRLGETRVDNDDATDLTFSYPNTIYANNYVGYR